MKTEYFVAIVIFHYFGSLFFHSFYLHRYGTHSQFTMNRFWERFFYVCTWISQATSFLNPTAYAKMHLQHHEHSDTKDDPHSPANFSFWKWGLDFIVAAPKMMWRTKQIFYEIRLGTHSIAALYKERRFPRWEDGFEKFADSNVARLIFAVLIFLFYWFFVPTWWCWFFLPVTLLSGPIQGAVVNWCGHKWGTRRFNTPDKSTNTPILNLISLGETNQNNHHFDAQRPNFARAWYEFDPIYPVILVFNFLGIIRLPQKV